MWLQVRNTEEDGLHCHESGTLLALVLTHVFTPPCTEIFLALIGKTGAGLLYSLMEALQEKPLC